MDEPQLSRMVKMIDSAIDNLQMARRFYVAAPGYESGGEESGDKHFNVAMELLRAVAP